MPWVILSAPATEAFATSTLQDEPSQAPPELASLEESAAAATAGEEASTETALSPVSDPNRLSPLQAHLVILFATIGCFAPLYSVQALFPAIGARFATGVGYAAGLLTVCTVGLTLFSPIAGRIGARAGVRRAVQLAFAGLILTNLAMSVVESAGAMLLLRLAQGCLIPIGLSALLASLGSVERSSGAVGLSASYSTSIILGGLIGRFLPAALVGFSWTVAFVGFACFQALLAAAVLRLFPAGPIAAAASTAEPLVSWLKSVGRVVRHEIPAVAIGGFALMATQAGITSFIAIRLASPPFDWSLLSLGALYLVFVPAIVAVRLTPAAIRRMGSKRTLLVSAAAMWLSLGMTLSDNERLILVGLVVFSAAVFTSQTVFAHELSTTKIEDRERASSGYLSAYYGGACLGSLAPAAAWHSWGWPGCLATVALIQVLGLVLALFSRVRSIGMSHL